MSEINLKQIDDLYKILGLQTADENSAYPLFETFPFGIYVEGGFNFSNSTNFNNK